MTNELVLTQAQRDALLPFAEAMRDDGMVHVQVALRSIADYAVNDRATERERAEMQGLLVDYVTSMASRLR